MSVPFDNMSVPFDNTSVLLFEDQVTRETSPASDADAHDQRNFPCKWRERTSSGKTTERERELYLDTDSVDQLHLADATATQMVQAGGRVPFGGVPI